MCYFQKMSNRDWLLIFLDIWVNFYVIAKKERWESLRLAPFSDIHRKVV